MESIKDLKELKTRFVSGNFKFPEEFSIGDGIEYRYIRSVNHSLEDLIHKGFKAMMVYALRPTDENKTKATQAELQDWLVFLWGMDPKHRMLPYTVRTINRARGIQTTHQPQGEVTEDYKEISQDRIIPDKVKVMLLDLPVARELIGKVDTGADICSLHAENIEVNRGTRKVSFDCPPLSDNRITVPLLDQQAVQSPSSDGTTYRPVIELNIKVADKALKNIRVNLNDRSSMQQPFLVGQNALEAGNFIIDPNIIKESSSEEDLIRVLTEEFKTDIVEEDTITQENIEQLFDLFENSNITFKELIKVLRTETINRLNKLDY